MKNKLPLVLILVFFTGISCFGQAKHQTIKFKFRYDQGSNDIAKFFVYGDITEANKSSIEQKINSNEGVSNFKIRDIKTKECIVELEKTVSCPEFKQYLMESFLTFHEDYVLIVDKPRNSKK